MSAPKLTVTADFTKEFNELIKKFKRDAVLVGIPEVKAGRKDDEELEKGPINNAALLAIQNFGSEAANIPARPVMEIGIRNAQPEISAQFRVAARKALEQGLPALAIYYERIGIIASNAVKKAINAQEGFDGPSEATLKARESQGFKGTKALIVTGQMRNAITYVVKGDDE